MPHSTTAPTDHQRRGAEDYQRELQTDDDVPVGLKKLAIVLRDEFRLVASNLDEHTKNVNIARVSGGSLAIAGGVTSIVGVAMIPVTLGISALVARFAGAGIAAAGGLVAGGASFTKIFIEKFKLKPLIQKWSDFNGMLRRHLEERDPDAFPEDAGRDESQSQPTGVAEVAASAARAFEAGRRAVQDGAGAVRAGAGSMRAGAGSMRAGAAAARVVGAETAAAARVTAIAAGSIALNAILIGISLYDIIDGSIELHKQKGSKAGDYLRQMADSLDEFAHEGLPQTFLESL